MEENTKDILIKLFRKYAQTNRISETQFLTEQDFRYLIHDKSFPVELPVIKPTLTILEIELLENLIRDNREEGTYYGNKKHYYKRMETIEQKLNKMREAL